MLLQGPAPAMRRTGVNLGSGAARLEIAASLSDAPQAAAIEGERSPLWWTRPQLPADTTVTLTAGRFSFQSWAGQGGMAPFPEADRDAFTAVARPEQALRAAVALSPHWSFAAEAGSGRRQALLSPEMEDGTSYGRAAFTFRNDRLSAAFVGGRMDERLGPLGSYVQRGTQFALPSDTRFFAVNTRWSLPREFELDADAGMGRTVVDGQILSGAMTSSSWRLAGQGRCGAMGLGAMCSMLQVELSQPLRIERGGLNAVLPDVPQAWDDPITFSARHLDARPSGRELDLRMVATTDLRRMGVVRLQAFGMRDADNVADRGFGYGVMGDWRIEF
jgi:hypothetical protein